MGDFEDNLHVELEQAQKKNQKNKQISTLFKLVDYYYNNSEFNYAIIHCKKILKLSPKEKEVNYYLGLIEIQKEDLDLAQTFLRKELKLNPKNERVQKLLKKLEIQRNFPIMTLTLLILNSLVFFFHIYTEISFIDLIKFSFSLHHFDISTLFISLFFHVNLVHYLINMIFLVMFGLILEKLIGSYKFILIYFFSGFVGNFFQAISVADSFVLGASSAIFGIIGGIVMSVPLLKTKILGLIKIPIIVVFGAFFAISSFLTLFIEMFSFMAGDIAHIFGFLTGILITGIIYRDTIGVFYNWVGISFGFWILVLSLRIYLFENQLLRNSDIFYLLFFILVSLFLIIYSYFNLKIIKGERLEQ